MADVITMGEMLIDFVPMKKGVPLDENKGFYREPGGAPANVAVGVSRLGESAKFLGKLGKDAFGNFLIRVLEENGVETSDIIQTDEAKTALAFVTLDERGDRDFIFYREPSADMLYRIEEIPEENVFQKSKIFHYGSISLINEPVRETTLQCSHLAKKNGNIVSYDPNLRPPLWPDLETARNRIIAGMEPADMVKISEEELEFITGETDLEKGCRKLNEYNLDIIFVSLGEKGCYTYSGDQGFKLPTFKVKVADTTGAGDGFTAGILYQLLKNGVSDLNLLEKNDLEQMVDFANAVGSLSTTDKGAIKSLPDLEKVNNLMKNGSKLT
ncbi:MAG: PfkB family carbohydrate kinase [Halanaerobiaceae bacterium]